METAHFNQTKLIHVSQKRNYANISTVTLLCYSVYVRCVIQLATWDTDKEKDSQPFPLPVCPGKVVSHQENMISL